MLLTNRSGDHVYLVQISLSAVERVSYWGDAEGAGLAQPSRTSGSDWSQRHASLQEDSRKAWKSALAWESD